MEDVLKHSLAVVICFLIMCCVRRQRRYWRELQENRPSGSIRVGYTLSIFTIIVSLAASVILQADWMWEIFISVLLVTLVFCVKITFSPSVIALTLAMCTYRMYQHDEFPLMEVWLSLTSVITWRLPEDIRAAYACISFLWVLFAALGSSAQPEMATDSGLDGIGDAVSGLHA